MSLVSIIIPCYNYGWLLAETLDSVLAQTYQNWECIIIDDGSTDNTRAVVDTYQARDPRFRYIYQKNGGLSAARNTGLQHANGTYLQLLDADDLLAQPKLSKQVALLQARPEVDIVYGEVRYFLHESPATISRSIDMRDSVWMVPLHSKGSPVVRALLKGNQMVVNAPLIKSSLVTQVGAFQENLKSMEDWDFWMRCAISGATFYYQSTPDVWAFVRVHESSMSQNRSRMLLMEEKVRASLTKPLDNAGLSEAAELNKKLLRQLRNHNAQLLLHSGELRQGLGKYWQMARESGHYLLYLREALYVLRHRSA